MPSLLEMAELVNQGTLVDPAQLSVYQESSNSAEKFLAHHTHAMLDLRRARQHVLQALEAIDYSDQKVLSEFIAVAGFLGLTDQRAAPIVKFGAAAINRCEYALGIEAIASAVAHDLAHGGAFMRDRENCNWIARQYQRAAQCVGWSSGQDLSWNNKQMRIALIVSVIADDEPSARLLRGLAKFIDAKRYKLFVYSTECGVRRDRQQFALGSFAASSSKRGGKTLELLLRQKISATCASVEGDCVTAARELADQMIKDRIDVAIFDATQADPVAALLASWEVASSKINLVRRTPMYSPGVNSLIYLDQVRYEADADLWRRKGTESSYMLEGIDPSESLGAVPARSACGIPENSIVLASLSDDLDKTLSDEFVELVIQTLRENPNAIYLAIGDGELSAQKRRFESAGIGKRIGYAGKRRDLPGFLRIADIYLAEFPSSNPQGVLQAMAVERPVVALKWGNDAVQSQSAILVGGEFAVQNRDTSAYAEKLQQLIRDPNLRRSTGRSLRGRVEQLFAMSQTARHLEQLCDQLLTRKLATAEAQTILRDEDGPVAAVA